MLDAYKLSIVSSAHYLMMRVLQIFVLCAFSYVGALDIVIDGPVLLLDCRDQRREGSLMVESTSTSLSTESPVDPKEFFDAARDGDLSFINAAISRMSSSGLDLNWRNTDHEGRTALHTAAEKDQSSILGGLLDGGADPDVQNEYGWTPMLIAVEDNHISVLRLLLDPKYQADVNLQDHKGISPVYTAAEKGHNNALELLLSHGGDPNKVNKYGNSPLTAALYYNHGEAARMLIQAGAHANYVDPEDGRTALHWAAMHNHPEVVLLLLQNGADKNKQNNWGITAADGARVNGNDSVAQLIENY